MSRISTQPDAQSLLASGYAAIAQQYHLPNEFPEEAASQAQEISQCFRDPATWLGGERIHCEQLPLATLDPAESTDLDQAFFLEKDGESILLHYALADVGAFVPVGSPVELEAWNRGVTVYGFAQKVPLYPTEISQQAASLLPDGLRPAFLVTVELNAESKLRLRAIERVICQSRAKLDYASVDIKSIEHLDTFAQRMWTNEAERGAMRFQFPEQEVITDPSAPGGVRLDLRYPLYSEQVNATLSLAVNIAIAQQFMESQTGLFRVMDEPDPRALKRLRLEAHALGIPWPQNEPLLSIMRRLDASNFDHKRFLLTARRAGGRASYALYTQAKLPWHFAIAAPYVHATAPMRRLADRYVLELSYGLFHQQIASKQLQQTLATLPQVMDSRGGRARAVVQAVIDLVEAITLQPRIGQTLDAEVVDADAQIVQTLDSAIRSRAVQLPSVNDGDRVRVRIDAADPSTRKIVLTAV